MARPKTGDNWIRWVREEYEIAREPKPTSKDIAKSLRKFPADETGPPGDRQIRRIIKGLTELTPEERREYSFFSWPDSMGDDPPLIPWEASRELLDLVRDLYKYPGAVIPVSVARWYWRVCLAMPGASKHERLEVAGQLAVWDVPDQRESPRHAGQATALMAYLAFQPWRANDEEVALYRAHLRIQGLEPFSPEYERGGSVEHRTHVVELLHGFKSPGIHELLVETFTEKRLEGEASNDETTG